MYTRIIRLSALLALLVAPVLMTGCQSAGPRASSQPCAKCCSSCADQQDLAVSRAFHPQ